MVTIKLKLLAGLLLLGVGAGAVAYTGTGAVPGFRDKQPQAEKNVAAPQQRSRLYHIASPRDGIVLAIGTEIKKSGKPAPAGARSIEVKIGNQTRTFLVLKEGDTVEPGQMLVQLDDRLARNDLLLKKAKLVAAKAYHAAAITTAKEAQARLDRLDNLGGRHKNLVSPEDAAAAVLTRDRYAQEEISKREAVNLAAIEVQQAEIIVDQHAIRSAVRGTIRAILKNPGEGVRALETVMEIEPVEKK